MSDKKRITNCKIYLTSIKPEAPKIYYIDWKDYIWSKSENLFWQAGESKEDFLARGKKSTNKKRIWFD